MKSKPLVDSEDDWRAKSDADSLMRAEEIKGDKQRHGAAMVHVKKTAVRAQSIMSKPKPAARPTRRK